MENSNLANEVTDSITDEIRRQQLAAINRDPGDRTRLEAEHGQVWDSAEVARDFELESFAAPLVVGRRKSDDKRGSLYFQHHPRFYWGFLVDE